MMHSGSGLSPLPASSLVSLILTLSSHSLFLTEWQSDPCNIEAWLCHSFAPNPPMVQRVEFFKRPIRPPKDGFHSLPVLTQLPVSLPVHCTTATLAPHYSLNTSGMLPPQNIFHLLFLLPGRFFPWISACPSTPTSYRSLLTCPLLARPSLTS